MEEFLENLCESRRTMSEENWALVLVEYYEIKGTATDITVMLSRDVMRLHSHLYLLELTINELRYRYSDDLAHALKILGYSFRYTENYHDQLDRIIDRSKTKYIQLQQVIDRLNAEIKKIPETNQKPKREYFDGLLCAIEEMQGVSYSFDTMMVMKFATLEKKYWYQVNANRKPNK